MLFGEAEAFPVIARRHRFPHTIESKKGIKEKKISPKAVSSRTAPEREAFVNPNSVHRSTAPLVDPREVKEGNPGRTNEMSDLTD